MGIEVFASALITLAGGLIFSPDNLTLYECNIEREYTCYRDGDMTLISSRLATDYYDFGVIATKNPVGVLNCYDGVFTKFEKFMTDYKYEKFNVSRCIFPNDVLSSFLLRQKKLIYLYIDKVSLDTKPILDYSEFSKKIHENPYGVDDWISKTVHEYLHPDKTKPLDIMQDDLFSGLSKLEHISLVNSGISIIKNDKFYSQAKLTTLNLNNNKIHSIEERAFLNLKELRELSLQYNKLVYISNWFTNCDNLRMLNISFNTVYDVEETAFDNLKKLEMLDLSHNHMSYSSARKLISNSFTVPVKINFLNLSHNNIENIEDSWDTYLQFVELDLSHNNIKNLIIETLQVASENTAINLKHNKLVKFSIIFLKSKIKKQTNIKFFLEGNPIECDCGLNTIVKNLRTNVGLNENIIIDIDNSSICYDPMPLKRQPLNKLTTPMLKCDCPTGCLCSLNILNHIQVVNCFNSNLPMIIPEFRPFNKVALKFKGENVHKFDSFMVKTSGRNIVALDLSGNSISDVTTLIIPQNIEVLDLRNNSITHVDSAAVEMLRYYKNLYLYINNNPIACDCENLDFISYVQEKQFTEALSIICEDGKHIYDVSKTICYEQIIKIMIGIVIFIVIIVFLCCCCKCSRKVKSDKKFDVYLAHAPIDSAFVTNKIAPMLQERGLRVLGDDKYFNRGEGTLELISKCDTVVLVISPTLINAVLSRPELMEILGNLIVERAADVTLVRYEGQLDHVVQVVKCGGSPKDPEYSLRLGMRTVRCYKIEDPEFLDRLPKVKGRGKIKYMKNEEAVRLL